MRVTARLVWITWAVGLLAVIALAAPGPLVTGVWAQEEGPTATATHFLGPTYTPTPTLPPPPPGGGLVNTTYLAVLPDPAVGSGYLGELPYGAPVHPVARSEDGDWVAIEWPAQNPERGAWISAAFVTWDAALDLGALPVLQAPYSITPVPSLTPTVTDTPEPSSTPEPSPTEARGGETAAPTETPQPAPAVIQPTPTSATSALPPSPGPALPGWLPIAIAGGLAGLLYAVFLIRGLMERRRYREGFVVKICPACQIGHLELDEQPHAMLGLPQVRRSVRCSYCHSVLRQVRPGVWRYSLDHFANARMAELYHGKLFTDAELQGLADRAEHFKPSEDTVELAGAAEVYQRADEFVAELEARFLAEREQEEALETLAGDQSSAETDEMPVTQTEAADDENSPAMEDESTDPQADSAEPES